jgi:hypothetical protein
MPVAFYMKFRQGHHGSQDRLGGVPSHLPPAFPKCDYSGEEMAFLGQFYCGVPRLDLPDTLCIQLYQDRHVGEGGDPCPVEVRVPLGAAPNDEGLGLQQKGVIAHDIEYEERVDPDTEPEFPEDLPLYSSKIGGLCLSCSVEEPDRYLLQLDEDPGDFNFAGRNCIVAVTPDGQLKVYLG